MAWWWKYKRHSLYWRPENICTGLAVWREGTGLIAWRLQKQECVRSTQMPNMHYNFLFSVDCEIGVKTCPYVGYNYAERNGKSMPGGGGSTWLQQPICKLDRVISVTFKKKSQKTNNLLVFRWKEWPTWETKYYSYSGQYSQID